MPDAPKKIGTISGVTGGVVFSGITVITIICGTFLWRRRSNKFLAIGNGNQEVSRYEHLV